MRDYGVRVSRTGRLATAAAVVLASTAPMLNRVSAAGDLPGGLGTPVVTVSRSVSLGSVDVSRISAAARDVGAVPHVIRHATLAMTAYIRGDGVLMQQPKGWRVPMSTRILPVEFVRATGGEDMAAVLAAGQVIMGGNSARIRDAEVGDVVSLRDSRNRVRRFAVGMIVSNDFAEGEDLIMSSVDGLSLGVTSVSRVSITGFGKVSDLYAALRRRKVDLGATYRLRTSWDLPDPDQTLGVATAKLLLGEFAFRPSGSSAIHVEDSWRASNINWFRRYSAVPLRNNCHKKVVDAIEGALRDVAKAGLAGKIDVANSNRYGGCFVGRYNRLAGIFGAPSRHAYGMAIDMNTLENAQWKTPVMDCDVVRIFRKWGFAWGGNFWPTDGMHFEWVGERRDQIGFPSRYCPNKVPVPTTTVPVPTTSTTTSTSTTSTSTTVPSVTTTTDPSATTTVPVIVPLASSTTSTLSPPST